MEARPDGLGPLLSVTIDVYIVSRIVNYVFIILTILLMWSLLICSNTQNYETERES